MARGKGRRQTQINESNGNANEANQTDVEDNNLDQNQPSTSATNHVVDVDDSDTETDHSSHRSSSSKPKIQIFKGLNDKVSIENWIKRFEMLAVYHKWSDTRKGIMLGNFLEDDALNWYIENYENDNYVELKFKMLSRFGLETVEPIIEFVNLKYDIKTGIKDYFETKRRLGVLAKLTEAQMIPLLIHNLHPKMADCFTAVKPKTFAEFYSIAKTAENNMKRNFLQKPDTSNYVKPKTDQTRNQNKRKPPNPCKICENKGFKNRYHWSQDCRNKSPNPTQPQSQGTNKTVNNIEN